MKLFPPVSPSIARTHYKISLNQEIICAILHEDAVITVDIAKEMVKDGIEVSAGHKRIFVDICKMHSIDGESRRYLAAFETAKDIIGTAILFDNYLHYLMLSVFLKVDRPIYPTKIFTNEKKALLWLRELRND